MTVLERLYSHNTASCSTTDLTSTCRAASQLRLPKRLSLLGQQSSCRAESLAGRSNPGALASLQRDCRTKGLPANNGAHTVIADAEGCEIDFDESKIITKFIAETLLPTRHGKFRLRGYKHSVDGGVTFTEPTAIVSGNVEGLEDVAVRVHDACFTSEVLGSLKCDCAEQLTLTLQRLQREPPGMVIYLQQEGRGIGLANKIAAYSLQERGLDTVDANRALGLPDDCREYTSVRNMLRDQGVKSIRLITNNPRKISQLKSLGIKVTGRIPCLVQAGEHSQGYMDTKRDKMAHMLNGEFCYWNHDGEPTQPVATAYAQGGMDLPEALKVKEG